LNGPGLSHLNESNTTDIAGFHNQNLDMVCH
jgi:hypothetical protein